MTAAPVSIPSHFDNTMTRLFQAYQNRDTEKAKECFAHLQVDPETLEMRVQLLFSEKFNHSDHSKDLNSFKRLVETIRIIPPQDISKRLQFWGDLHAFREFLEKGPLQAELVGKILNSPVDERREILRVARQIEEFIQPSHYGKQWILEFTLWLPQNDRLEVGEAAQQLAQNCPALKSHASLSYIQASPYRIQQRCAVIKTIARLPRNERLETTLTSIPLIQLIGLKPNEIDSILKAVNLNLNNHPNTTIAAATTFFEHYPRREALDFESIFTLFNTLDEEERIKFGRFAGNFLTKLEMSFKEGLETLKILSHMQGTQSEDVAALLENTENSPVIAHILYLIAPEFRKNIVEFYRVNPHLALFGLKEQLTEIFKDAAIEKASRDYLQALFTQEKGHAKFYRLLQPYILYQKEPVAEILEVFETSKALWKELIEPKTFCPSLDLATCPSLPILQSPLAPLSPKTRLRANETRISRI